MNSITFSVVVGDDRRLIIELPDEVPVGPADVTIKPHGKPTIDQGNLTRETARAKLLAAGKLAIDLSIPDDIEPETEEELDELGRLAPGSRPSEELVDEDRGTY